MQLINAVDAKIGDTIAMITTDSVAGVFTSGLVMGVLVSRVFEDHDGWITLTIETPAGNVAHDFPFNAQIVLKVKGV